MSIHAFEMLDVSGAGALKCERTKEKVCREANERERKDLTYEQSKLKTFRGKKEMTVTYRRARICRPCEGTNAKVIGKVAHRTSSVCSINV